MNTRLNNIAPIGSLLKPPRVEKPKKRMRSEREIDPDYLASLRQLPCVVCQSIPCDAAHVRYTSGAHGKRNTPMGQKPSDRWALSLCRKHHDDQHRKMGERNWWVQQNINPILVCAELYAVRGDLDAMRSVVMRTFRERATTTAPRER